MFSGPSPGYQSGAITVPSPSVTCKYFNSSRGHCRYGERCRFIHEFDVHHLENNPAHHYPDPRQFPVHQYGERVASARRPQLQHLANGGQRIPEAGSWRSRDNPPPTTTTTDPRRPVPEWGRPDGIRANYAPTVEQQTKRWVQPVPVDPPRYDGRPRYRPESVEVSYRSGSTQNQVCRYFAKGFCKRGDHCEYAHPPDLIPQTTSATKVCQYFSRGYCRMGTRCHYAHLVPERSSVAPQNDLNRRQPDNVHSVSESSDVSDDDNEVVEYLPIDICSYKVPLNQEEKSEEVSGADVNFKTSAVEGSEEEEETGDGAPEEEGRPVSIGLLNGDYYSNKTELRETEITMLKKRINAEDLLELGDDGFVVNLSSSDPDWPFDIKSVKLMIRFGATYPNVPPETEIREKDNPLFPPKFAEHLTDTVREWFQEQHRLNAEKGIVALLFRPFLRWFDRNMEAQFTRSLRLIKCDLDARAAGLQFVPFQRLLEKKPKVGPANDVDQDQPQEESAEQSAEGEAIEQSTEGKPVRQPTQEDRDAQESTTKSSGTVVPLSNLQSARKGTAVKLCNLRLGENVAAVTCQKLSVVVQCTRCKWRSVVRTAPRRRNLVKCNQCSASLFCTFRPSLVHAFDATLGYLDLDACFAVDIDLVECIFAVQCLECLKQFSTDGINFGVAWLTWCHACNTKMEIYVDSPKFQILQPNNTRVKGAVDQIKSSMAVKKVKNSAIQDGKPLPDYGTCKHYKKSYRWFRFPCCGKAYPCDLCHNERELEHEMKLANRVICGYCAKEQPFIANKSCIGCTLSMTNLAKGHWEGGKGCRDKVKMSRDDKQKYSGVAKTVSRKVKELKEKK